MKGSPSSHSFSSTSTSSASSSTVDHSSDRLPANKKKPKSISKRTSLHTNDINCSSNDSANASKKCKKAKTDSTCHAAAGRRSSIYRGVTRHRWTGRFEAHLWDKSSWNTIQNKKGKQGVL
ncbi:hypothetical protein Droror1_Dr00022936 [Drosera rotundifolia]